MNQCVGHYKHPEQRNTYCAMGAIFHDLYGYNRVGQDTITLEDRLKQDYRVPSKILDHIVTMNDHRLLSFKEICEDLKKRGY